MQHHTPTITIFSSLLANSEVHSELNSCPIRWTSTCSIWCLLLAAFTLQERVTDDPEGQLIAFASIICSVQASCRRHEAARTAQTCRSGRVMVAAKVQNGREMQREVPPKSWLGPAAGLHSTLTGGLFRHNGLFVSCLHRAPSPKQTIGRMTTCVDCMTSHSAKSNATQLGPPESHRRAALAPGALGRRHRCPFF